MICNRFPWAYAGLAALFALAIATPGLADETQTQSQSQEPDTAMVRIGGYHVSGANTIVRLDAANAPTGVYIDFDQTLGGDSSANVARIDGYYRFTNHSGLGYSWYGLRLTGNRTLQNDITWGDINFPAGTGVSSEMKYNVYKVNYQYSLINNPEVELGGLLGLNVMTISAKLDSTGPAPQGQADSVTAPLPVIGIYARYNFTPKFSIYTNYQFFFLNNNGDKVSGNFQDFLLGLEYRVWRHVALGAAYNRLTMSLESRKNADATLYANSSWKGVMLYVGINF